MLRNAATLVDKAVDSHAQSFFLAFGLKRPHLGWFAPQWAFDEYAPNGSIPLAPHREPPLDMPEVAFYDNGEMIGMQDVTQALVNDTSGYPLIVDWKQHELRRAYYASVTFMDSQLGAILDTIEELNLRGRINMAFVGDHGYGLGEHGEWCKQSNFETTTRVPLFFVGPGITPGSVDSASLVEMLDIAPTLTDLAGITVPFQTPGTRWQGASLADLLLAPPPTVAPAGFDAAFSQFPRVYKPSEADAATAELVATAYAAGVGALPAARFEGDAGADADWETVVEMLRVGAAGNTMGLSMRTPTWRYTEWRPFNFSSAQVDWTQTHGTELYNHSSDTGSGPGVFDDFENVNLAPNPEHASTVQQLSQQLRAAWDNPTFKAEQARASRRAT